MSAATACRYLVPQILWLQQDICIITMFLYTLIKIFNGKCKVRYNTT